MATATREDWDNENRRGLKAFGEQRFLEAEEILTGALALAEEFGARDPFLPTALNNLALVLHTAGRPAEAEPLYRRALECVRQNASGKAPESSDPATEGSEHGAEGPGEAGEGPEHATKGTGKAGKRSGKAAKRSAEGSAEGSGEGGAKGSGEDVAVAASNLALVLRDLGRYAEAEPLLTEALAILEKAWGAEDPRLCSTLDKLASVYRARDRMEQAEASLKRGLALREMDPAGTGVPAGLEALADLYLGWGEYPRAEALYVRLLKLHEQAKGPESLEVAGPLTALGRIQLALGKPAKAEPFSKRALAIRERALGPHHPEVAGSLNNLAYVCQKLGKYAAAEPMYKRSLALAEQTLGPDHPNVAVCLDNYASVLLKLRKKAEASRLEERAKAIRSKQPAK